MKSGIPGLAPARHPGWRFLALCIGADAVFWAILTIAISIEQPALGLYPHPEAAGRLFVFGLCLLGVGAGVSIRWPDHGFLVFGAGFIVLALATLVGDGLNSETVRVIPVILTPGAGYTWLGIRELAYRRATGVEGARSAILNS